jgi:hypothetical protein
MITAAYPEISKELQKRVPRNREGKWLFCLAEYDHRRWPGKFRLAEVTPYTTEASARIYFKKELEMGNCVLIKVPEQMALHMKSIDPEGRQPVRT